MPLSEEQYERYTRHILLSDIGEAGQERLLDSTVAVELRPNGAPEVAAIIYLAAAGVGCIVLSGAVRDPVTESEVGVGLAYGASDVGRARLDAIRERVTALNPDVRVVPADEQAAVDAHLPAMDLSGDVDLARALVHGCSAAARLLGELSRGRR